MLTAIVIPVDLQQPIRQQQLNEHDLDAYRQLVGGHLEVINLDRPPASLYFNEEGKLLELPVNIRATTILWAHHSAFRGKDAIMGPALIVGPVDRHGDDQTAPPDLIDLLFHTTRYRVQVQTQDDNSWRSNGRVFTDCFEAYAYGVHLAQSRSLVSEVRIVPELDEQLRQTWYQLGRKNPWIKMADDPPFTSASFVGCYSIEELAERIGHGNWCIGTAFYYHDLCFINQVEGGDEWLTIRHGIAPEGPSALFLSFMKKFAPGSPSGTGLNRIYDVRGEITHGERLLHLDQALPTGLDQTSARDTEIGDAAGLLCRGALVNWLWSHDPAATEPLLTKGLPSTKPARPGTKSKVIVTVPGDDTNNT